MAQQIVLDFSGVQPALVTWECSLTAWGIKDSEVDYDIASWVANFVRGLAFTQMPQSVSALRCSDAQKVHNQIVSWLADTSQRPQEFRGHARVALETVPKGNEEETMTQVWLLVCSDIAWSQEHGTGVSILCLVLPQEFFARWYFHLNAEDVRSFGDALMAGGLVQHHTTYGADTVKCQKFVQNVADSRKVIFTFPHSPAFEDAMEIEDYCPVISEPDTAELRLQSLDYLQASKLRCNGYRDLENDRYKLELPLAEKEIASVLQCSCAEYLLLKRQFFVKFWRLLIESGKAYTDVDLAGTQASDTAKNRHRKSRASSQFCKKDHHNWLRDMGVSAQRQYYLVAVWEELGFTDDAAVIERGRLVDGWRFKTAHWVDSSGQSSVKRSVD